MLPLRPICNNTEFLTKLALKRPKAFHTSNGLLKVFCGSTVERLLQANFRKFLRSTIHQKNICSGKHSGNLKYAYLGITKKKKKLQWGRQRGCLLCFQRELKAHRSVEMIK